MIDLRKLSLFLSLAALALASLPAAFADPAPAAPAVADSSTLVGKVMCGYQGWFDTPGDGAGRGWIHWPSAANRCAIDLWPDMTEYAPELRYKSNLHNLDGSPAELYSPQDAGSVDLHFKWMRDYGIDGVFLQRFKGTVSNASGKTACDKVLDNVVAGAHHYGRVYGVMYDLSGMHPGTANEVIADWKTIVDRIHPKQDDRYIRYNGRPLVTFWGIGFSGSRQPLLEDAMKLIDFMHNDPQYGGYSVMIGVPMNWRTLDSAAVPHDQMMTVAKAADIITPWSVGSFHTPADVAVAGQRYWAPDIAWCNENHVGFLPVVYPGFSWHNLRKGTTPVDQIPRLGGRLLWSEYVAAKQAGATMVYQAMFDEVDEGTAIYKCTNTPPDGEGTAQFATFHGLPSDFYLRLVGEATRMIRGEIAPQDESLIAK